MSFNHSLSYYNPVILTRTPFRFTLGGGGTDLPSYYSHFGGLIFAAAIDKYMFLSVNRPAVDDLIRVKYSASETVEKLSEVKHPLAKAALEKVGIDRAIEIVSVADIPASTGLGSSSSYLVGLLNALYTLQRNPKNARELAEIACQMEIEELKLPVGKQDSFLAALGGLPVLEIDPDGTVHARAARIDLSVLDELNRNTLLFFTGNTRQAETILREQDRSVRNADTKVIDSLHHIKELGYKILEALECGEPDRFGTLMDEHWRAKQRLSPLIANPRHHQIYELARKEGALGGKIAGAGGGGFFVFYTDKHHQALRKALAREGLRELRYRFDQEGSRVLANFSNSGSRHVETSLAHHGLPGSRRDIPKDLPL